MTKALNFERTLDSNKTNLLKIHFCVLPTEKSVKIDEVCVFCSFMPLKWRIEYFLIEKVAFMVGLKWLAAAGNTKNRKSHNINVVI